MIDREIMDFINKHKIATVCTSTGDKPYCFNGFYAVMEKEGYLVFKSAYSTRHMEMMAQNRQLAGTIIPEKADPLLLQGIQFTGTLIDEQMTLAMQASAAYYLRYPMSVAIPGKLWIMELDHMKFTDHTKGMGHKTVWQRAQNK